ncbi:MAG: tRNA dihydrouridine synthase [Promethearchaeota archaeon]
MKLGSISLKNNLVLAPLQNVCSSPYRRFCRLFFDIGLVCVPMLYTKRLMHSPKSLEKDLVRIEEERPISVQLIGSDLIALKKAIEYLESYKFDVIDINAGCPSKRAIQSKEGGYLLKDLPKLERILKIACKYSSRPVSLKTRLGFHNTDKIGDLAKIVNNSNISFLTIHARTVESRFGNDTLNLDALKRIKELINVPLIGNGDITNPEIAKNVLEYTKVDALMIGRGSIGNPKIFHHINEYLTKKIKVFTRNNINSLKNYVKIYEQVLDDYIEETKLNYPIEKYKFTELKRNAIWLTKNIKESTFLRRELGNAKNLNQLRSILQNLNAN